MRIAGVMDAEQQAQMQQAQQQMTELEAQMQQMPESQRRMIMNTMGPQLEMMKNMASGGGIELVTDVHEVRVNAGLPDQVAVSSAMFGTTASPAASAVAPPVASASVSPASSAAGSLAASAASLAPATAQEDPAALREAQQACLQEKMAEAQAAQKKKRGIGRLMSAVTRTAVRAGNHEIARATDDIYTAEATAADLAGAARDLGLTEDQVAACRIP
jgi:hypothetical protein